MSKFIKFLGHSHLNSMNVALYDSGAVRAENVVNGKSIGARTFPTPQAAEDWFDALAGDNNTEKTSLAIDALNPKIGAIDG